MTGFPALDPLEIASGVALGTPERPAGALPEISVNATPRRALSEVILPALARPPCVVSFSGGRDSSAILAVAVHLARSEGLPLPVPVTLRFSSVQSNEDAWQEAVIRHLDLDDWQLVHIDHELDVVGPAATSLLRTFGPYLPCNLHFHLPILDAARGGTLLTGVGGDEIFVHWPSRLSTVAALRRRRSRQGLMASALAVSPTAARRALLRWHRPLRLPWLRPAAAGEVARIWARQQAVHLRSYQLGLDAFLAGRNYELLDRCLALVGRSFDVSVRHPFFDRHFLATLAGTLPRDGFPSRTSAMESLVGDLLPPSAVRRGTKAVFTEALWRPTAREFVKNWDGTGVDSQLVDPMVLKAVWGQPLPPWRSWTLLQTAWLSAQPQGAQRDPRAHRQPARGRPTNEAD